MLKLNIATFVICCLTYAATAQTNKTPITKEKAQSFFNAQPVKFLENAGQMTDASGKAIPFVLFKASVPGLDLYVTEKGLTYVFNKVINPIAIGPDKESQTPDVLPGLEKIAYTWERVDMNLKDAKIRKENIIKENPEQGLYHYYYAHCPDGIKNVKQYGKLTIKNIYPGIDWVLYNSDKRGFKYDFIVHPGTDASKIQLLYSSLNMLNLSSEGILELTNTLGSLNENAPYSYIKENNQKVESQFIILSSEKIEEHYEVLVGVNLGNTTFFNSSTLVIDPQLIWATTMGGGSNETVASIDHDLYDNLFLTGFSQSINFPTQSYGSAYYQGTGTANLKAIITKFNNAGILIWCTYYAGSSGDGGMSISVDSLANIFVAGQTQSMDLPTQNAGGFFQGTYSGANPGGPTDVFLLKFDNVGNRLWATYYGGSSTDFPYSIHNDKHGNVFVSGLSDSPDFPLFNAGTFFDQTFLSGNGFVLKFDNSTNRLWASFFGEDRCGQITTNNDGNVYLTGRTGSITTNNPGGGAYFQANPAGGPGDAYIAKFDNTGNLLWSTYFGGNGDEWGKSLVCDHKGNVFMVGTTSSTNLPLFAHDNSFLDSINSGFSPVVTDIFIVKFSPTGSMLWSTLYGGTNVEEMSYNDNLALDQCDRLYVGFETYSTLGITTASACETGYFKATISGGSDQFMTRFSNTGVLEWATYFGGDGNDNCSALDFENDGGLCLAGRWEPSNSSTYPFTNPGGGAYFSNSNSGMNDMFISKFNGGTVGQTPAFSYNTPCIGVTTTLTPVLSNTFVSGGFFSASQGLQINQQTGAIDITGVSAGNYTISYNYESCQCHKSDLVLSVSKCDGIAESIGDTGWLKIYGNPNNGEFIVKSGSEGALTLVNELGQIIKTLKLSSATNYEATLTGLVAGIYFLKDEHTQSNHKIVVIK